MCIFNKDFVPVSHYQKKYCKKKKKTYKEPLTYESMEIAQSVNSKFGSPETTLKGKAAAGVNMLHS